MYPVPEAFLNIGKAILDKQHEEGWGKISG